MKQKLIHDSIHGYIELNPLCLSIIDTPEFQRLRDIKQLGICYFVFPNANHTRFEHSVGVAHLSREIIKNISMNQPDLGIDSETIENVQIAGLCHDLGHGPFSHLFDYQVLKDSNSPNVVHEVRSCQLFEHLIRKNNIELSDNRIEIIKELIHPINKLELNIPNYIYQIVCNVTNNIDVDKFDYLKRDSYTLGLSYSFDYTRIIQQARIISNQICFPEKISNTMYQIFITRWRLHKEIYTHPIVRCIELMIVDCLKYAESHLKLVESIDNMDKFYKITDSILKIIELSTCPELEESRNLLDNIKKRNLYIFVGEIKLSDKCPIINQEIDLNTEDDEYINLKNENTILDIVKIGYSSDPIENVKFYNISKPDQSFILNNKQNSNLIPNTFSDNIIRVYCKNRIEIDKSERIYNYLKSNYGFY